MKLHSEDELRGKREREFASHTYGTERGELKERRSQILLRTRMRTRTFSEPRENIGFSTG